MEIHPISGALGAECTGVDLSVLSDALMFEIKTALMDHQVIFFPNQNLSTVEHRDLAMKFGTLDIPKFVPPFEMPKVKGHPEIYQLLKEKDDQSINIGGFWHADVTHRELPNKLSTAYIIDAPDYGGDTLYSSLYLAYETLSEGMKSMLLDLRAVHTSEMPYGGKSVRSPAISRSQVIAAEEFNFDMNNVEKDVIETSHPVVRRHPDTGRQLLYVNRGFTSRFEGMTRAESLPILDYLWRHTERPEFTCRYRWSERTLGIWDNRCVLHCALNDYYGQRRLVHRISVNEDERPSS
ncbi:MAG: taurine dioxygenase [Rhodospirillaceae bacterium]|nr:taurine dioxygenase [Rhodospirillaceae bacterium]